MRCVLSKQVTGAGVFTNLRYRPIVEVLESREMLASQLGVPTGLAFTEDGYLYVASKSNGVFRFDAEGVPAPRMGYSGATFIASGTRVSPINPSDMVVDSAGRLYVASSATDNVLVFNAITGGFIKTLAGRPSGVRYPKGLALGADGSLFVANAGSHSVLRYSVETGALIGSYAPEGIDLASYQPTRITFGPTGDFYVSDFVGNRVIQHDGLTGAFKTVFIQQGTGLERPTGLTFGADNFLYVGSSSTNQILKYDTAGILQGTFVASNLQYPPKGPADLAFGPNGNLFVTCAPISKVREFDGTTGLFVKDYVSAITPTNTYLMTLDRTLTRWLTRGTDYLNPYFSPLRLGKPLSQIDITYDYDFARLAQVRAQLAGVTRPVVLKAIFNRIVGDAVTNTEKHLRVLSFLQQVAVHNSYLQPMNPDRTMVTDPLVLLELGEMRCGHVAMVAVDLFRAAGNQGRLVQLGGHVIAGVFYDGRWHYLDANAYRGGQAVRLVDGRIPSVIELSRQPQLLDAVYGGKPLLGVPLSGRERYWSYFYFSRTAYTIAPGYYYKTTTLAQDAASSAYGWNQLLWVADTQRTLYSSMRQFAPTVPRLDTIAISDNGDGTRQVTLTWLGSMPVATDPANLNANVREYQIFLGNASRGWNYTGNSMNLPATYRSSSELWRSENYAAFFQMPPAAQVLSVTTTQATITLANDRDYYISVMAVDWYGSSIGRQRFDLSEEIVVRAISPAAG